MLFLRQDDFIEFMEQKTDHNFRIKRVYDEPSPQDGLRVLVDRLWPRGIKKETLPLAEWLRDVAPSPALRKWFGHEPAKWNEFCRRYRAELENHPESWRPLLKTIEKGNVTLLFAARDAQINHAVLLREFLEEKTGLSTKL